jgi:hypothetical protein
LEGNNHARPGRDFSGRVRDPSKTCDIRIGRLQGTITVLANEAQLSIWNLAFDPRPTCFHKPSNPFKIRLVTEESDKAESRRVYRFSRWFHFWLLETVRDNVNATPSSQILPISLATDSEHRESLPKQFFASPPRQHSGTGPEAIHEPVAIPPFRQFESAGNIVDIQD